MKQSATLIPTLREIPSEIEAKSHKMLLRAGFIRQSTSGVYSYLPLAKRILNKLEKMIHQEMEAIGAVEIGLPTLQPLSVLEHSRNYDEYRKELFQVSNRNNQNFILAPSHEEAMIKLIQDEIQSYKRYPITLYQIQTKYRDENRARNGLLRSREFLMKDAYSFHINDETLEAVYSQMTAAYSTILSKLGLHYEIIQADAGGADDAESLEFIIPADNGDTLIAYSDESRYAANIEIAEVVNEPTSSKETLNPIEKAETPNIQTIEEVCAFFEIEETDCIKALVYKIDGEFAIVLVRGDHQINGVKLKNVLQARTLSLASESEIQELLNCQIGYIGPIKLPVDVKVIADHAISSIRNGVAGANEDGYHYKNVNPNRDFAINLYGDIRNVKEGDPAPDGGTISFKRGIEVGKISKLGTSVCEKLNVNYMDENAQLQPIRMGSFNLGISRIFAVMADIFQDENGFLWPKQFSPYDIHLIPVNIHEESHLNLADELYNILTFYQFDVLFDDRDESVGVKFMDADLIGLPVRVTVGKRASEGIVEVKIRSTGEMFEWAKEELIDHLNEYFRSN
ncbi:proline--tRNA ligase [Lysinibacillus yapensis]|uniref:Proline--tRNA ligase n=1 Tax=Ureibacillus yapensis TaxID=2304605 RepID=A0A396SJQ9_9BACL|nr:proline--tRNA ligase [Lysinibacillus yapensis]RHW39609.1 proline--tRNA ligase [Lysinibacillus yapensis]